MISLIQLHFTVSHVKKCNFSALCLTLFFVILHLLPSRRNDPAMSTVTGEAPDTVRFAPAQITLKVFVSGSYPKEDPALLAETPYKQTTDIMAHTDLW